MTKPNYSMSEILNLATEIKELAEFQNTTAWWSEPFTFDFQQEFIRVLLDKSQQLESMARESEFVPIWQNDDSTKADIQAIAS